MADPILPRWQSPVLDAGGSCSREWYDFFRDLLALAGEQTDIEAEIAALAAAVAELQAATPDLGQLFGDMSVAVDGLLGQVVQLRLVNDATAPGTTYYYGTDADGTKGWHAVADALAQVDGIALTVDPDTGVITIGPANDLAAVEALTGEGAAFRVGADDWALRTIEGVAGETTSANENGVGGNPTIGLWTVGNTAAGTLLSVTVDVKGRVIGYRNTTTADLTPLLSGTYQPLIAFAANEFGARASTGAYGAKPITDAALSALGGTGGTDKYLRADGTVGSELLSTTGALTLGGAMYGGNLNYRAQRYNGTVGTPSAVAAGEVIMAFSSAGYDGTAMSGASARISWIAEANYAVGSHATQIAFGTTAAGSATQSSRLILQGNGVMRVAVNNAYAWGTAAFAPSDLFSVNPLTVTSDARWKTEVRPLTGAERAAAIQLSKEVGVFKFLHAIEKKGEDKARLHFGLTAQRIIEVFAANGLDAFAYGLVCYDAWEAWDEPEQRDKDGHLVAEAVHHPKDDKYSIRDFEVSVFIAAGIDARLNALEVA